MRYLFSAVCLLSTLQGFCQLFPPADYPHNYFRDPLAIPMSLAANFGELRPDHYHMGLDIRTQHRVNLPVFAAAGGYIARVSIAPLGFGQAIYINHPNGYTTVYGHLNRFFPALTAYIHKEQYRHQSWQIDLELPPSLFPVWKGELIAYSGSTGGSQGPHLHFEIRRTAGDINLNPLLFGLPVPDNTAPTILRLAWYDRDRSTYEQSPHLLPVYKTGTRTARTTRTAYAATAHATGATPTAAAEENASHTQAAYALSPSLLVVPASRISFALSTFDTQSGSTNPNGIFEADLFSDDRPVIGFRMDRISYDNTININGHIDYKTRLTGGPFLQHLSFLPGYPLPSIYSVLKPSGIPADPAAILAAGAHPADGVLDLSDGRPHAIRIEVRDPDGNTSTLSFRVQYRAALAAAEAPQPPTPPNAKRFYPGMVDGLELPGCAFYLGEKSLYDSVSIGASVAGHPGSGKTLPGGVSSTFAIGETYIPLHEPMLVRIQYNRALPADSVTGNGMATSLDHIVMVRFDGTDRDIERPEWRQGWASARFRAFGNFQLVEDTTPPVITMPGITEDANLSKAARIEVLVRDNLSGIEKFTAELDPSTPGSHGQWLCFTNDKRRAYLYTFDEKCPRGHHLLRITAQDVAGNTAVRELKFTR